MNASDLDHLLREARIDVTTHLSESAAQTSRAVAAHAGSRRRRRRWTIPVGVALGAVALTAAAPYVMPGMDGWPFVSITQGERRTEASIPVVYAGPDDATPTTCGAWMDVANATDADMERLNDAIEDHDWPALAYNPGSASDDPVFIALEQFIKHDVAGIGWGWDDPADDTSVHVTASGVLCSPELADVE
ncbi:MAG: hypothetical protein H5T82_07125 [Demequina sp.]|uniref:hypothetical protein n=1 Tax=Demequina sp. TaxID=2050685 RepID=UPI0019B73836|nr:hypothetical protein [Demequina sp.]MBC7298650.1 hypothetical protein [Demequina sp.]